MGNICSFTYLYNVYACIIENKCYAGRIVPCDHPLALALQPFVYEWPQTRATAVVVVAAATIVIFYSSGMPHVT